jgi:hypothetical protein
VNETDRHFRDLLEAAVGEPPHQVSVEAVRRRVTRRRAVECMAAAAAVVVAAVLVLMGIGALGRIPRPVGQQRSATAYVVNDTSGTVIPISTATNTPGPPIHVGSDITIAVTPDGTTAYAATWGKVVPISTATNTPGKPIRTGGGPPGGISITP